MRGRDCLAKGGPVPLARMRKTPAIRMFPFDLTGVFSVAVTAGFEPAVGVAYTTFRVLHLRPLGHVTAEKFTGKCLQNLIGVKGVSAPECRRSPLVSTHGENE